MLLLGICALRVVKWIAVYDTSFSLSHFVAVVCLCRMTIPLLWKSYYRLLMRNSLIVMALVKACMGLIISAISFIKLVMHIMIMPVPTLSTIHPSIATSEA